MSLLLKEEQLIVNILGVFGVLKKEQIFKLIEYKGEETSEKIILSLLKKGILFIHDEEYVSLSKDFSYEYVDEDIIESFWVFLIFAKKIVLGTFYLAQHPSSIFFLSKQKMYEIIRIPKDKEYLLNVIKRKNEFIENKENKTKYIVIVEDEKSIDKAVEYISGFDVAFALLSYKNSKIPTIEYKVLNG